MRDDSSKRHDIGGAMRDDPHELVGKRCVAYVRVSTDSQDGGSDNQEESIRRFAERHGITIRQSYKDNEGESKRGDGTNLKQFNAMYEDAKEGLFDTVIVAYQERLGLNGHYFGYWVVKFQQAGVSFYGVKERCLLSAHDPQTIERTAHDTAANTNWLVKHGTKRLERQITSAERGDHCGGIPPYFCDVACWDGDLTRLKYRLVYREQNERTQYVYDEAGGVILTKEYSGRNNTPTKDFHDRLRLSPTIVEGRLKAVRLMFDWFANECISLGHIAARLNDLGLPPYYTDYWNTTSIKSILRNPAVIGRPCVCKNTRSRYVVRGEDGEIWEREELGGKKTVQKKLPNDYWVFPSDRVFEPIVPDAVFYAVQRKLDKRRYGTRGGPNGPSRKARAWLKGFLYCAGCNKPMRYCDTPINGAKDKRDGVEIRTISNYRCGAYQSMGANKNPYGCMSNYVKAELLEKLVVGYLDRTEQMLRFDQDTAPSSPIEIQDIPMCFEEPDPKAKGHIEGQLKSLEAENKRLWKVASDINSTSAFQQAKEEMLQNDDTIDELRAELQAMSERLTKEEMLERIASAKQVISEGRCRAKKEALSQIIRRIYCRFDPTGGLGRSHSPKYRLAAVWFIPVCVSVEEEDSLEEQDRKRRSFVRQFGAYLDQVANPQCIDGCAIQDSFTFQDNALKRELGLDDNPTLPVETT